MTCPVPGASEAHEHMVDYPTQWTAAITAGAAVLYYAVPDFVASRFVRGAVKVAATSVAAATIIHADQDSGRDVAGVIDQINNDIQKAEPADVAAYTAAGIALVAVPTVLVEKAIYRRAEKKKRKGKKFPHLKQALVLGALTGAAIYYLDKK